MQDFPTPLPEAQVFIACSLDGFIARRDGDIGWLTAQPTPPGEDFGYAAFMAGIDALLMGRKSYEKVLEMDPWPYPVPVWVLSRSLDAQAVPAALRGRVTFTDSAPRDALTALFRLGARRVYVDGGELIRSCLREGLIARMTITQIPVLLGEGRPLFGNTGPDIPLQLETTNSWPNGFVQSVWRIRRG